MKTTDNIKSFITRNKDGLYRTHRELCLIPAPSFHEAERAKYCLEWLKKAGAEGAFIDAAGNAIFPLVCEGSDRMTVVNAHTDTVFPAETPLLFEEKDGIIRCPGVGDDTACLAVMLYAAKYFIESGFSPDGGLLFVCNTGEEGLGNLYGIREIYKSYAGKIARQISIDADYNEIFNGCVGSARFEVTVTTAGGHSFGSFGKPNAIAEAAKIITAIYGIKVPQKPGAKTTYNVGTISGGTSVNTIAQKASFLCEYRSDDPDCMDLMHAEFDRIFEEARSEKVGVDVKIVGIRPCASGADPEEIDRLTRIYLRTAAGVIGVTPVAKTASTDCNIPMSQGIPAVCVGAMISGGTHTTEEWLEKDSLLPGLEILIRYLSEIFESNE